jgi:hypothetical protein
MDLVLVDRHHEHAVGLQESAPEPQAALHEREPLARSPRVVGVDVVVVVGPVSVAGVVRRVEVDEVHLSLERAEERADRVAVLPRG